MDSETEMRQIVPEPFHDNLNVFSKWGVDTLPPYHPYDCPSELLPEAEIPFG